MNLTLSIECEEEQEHTLEIDLPYLPTDKDIIKIEYQNWDEDWKDQLFQVYSREIRFLQYGVYEETVLHVVPLGHDKMQTLPLSEELLEHLDFKIQG